MLESIDMDMILSVCVIAVYAFVIAKSISACVGAIREDDLFTFSIAVALGVVSLGSVILWVWLLIG